MCLDVTFMFIDVQSDQNIVHFTQDVLKSLELAVFDIILPTIYIRNGVRVCSYFSISYDHHVSPLISALTL